jgi:uncharacterized protein YecE (DUF72 family)
MQFGRIPDVSDVRFELPPLEPRSLRLLGQQPASAQRGDWLRLGAPAWSHRDWIGTLYPPGSTSQDWLRLYAEKLSAIELNSTFYALPSYTTVERWAATTPARFRFCPKVPRIISHELTSAALAERVRAFTSCMLRFGERLGPALLQLPESVSPLMLEVVRAALEAFPPGFSLALEVRHPAWFERGSLREDLLRLLEQQSIATVITDVSGRRDVCHASLTTPIAFVRFVGEGGHPTDAPRTDAWLVRLADWRAAGLQSAYLFVHQPDDLVAPQLLATASEQAHARGIEVPTVALESAVTKQLDLF